MQEKEINIAKNVRDIELLKAEMLESLGALYRNLVKSGTDGLVDHIAGLIINCFLLAKRLGFSFGQVDQQVYRRINAILKEENLLQEGYTDIAQLREYLDMKR